jgi:hypothetical protein
MLFSAYKRAGSRQPEEIGERFLKRTPQGATVLKRRRKKQKERREHILDKGDSVLEIVSPRVLTSKVSIDSKYCGLTDEYLFRNH